MEHLKQQLAVRFSDVTDAQSIQVFAARLLSLAEEAYDNQGGDAVERQLIDIFVDGMTNDQLKMKMLRDRPDNLQAAIGIATNEKNLRARVNMSHTTKAVHEPMEVKDSDPVGKQIR